MARSPWRSNVTEDPGPSTTRQPNAINKDSMRAHSMFPLIGSAHTDSSVRRCLLFTGRMIALPANNAIAMRGDGMAPAANASHHVKTCNTPEMPFVVGRYSKLIR